MMVPELFLIGLVVGFLYYELVGLSPGGVIPSAYFALFLRQPERMAVTLILALVVWAGIRLLQRHTFLYGRRRLLTALLMGFAVKWLAESVVAPAIPSPVEIHAIGYIVPGLIASDMVRQKVVPTALSLGIVTMITGLLGMLLGIGWGGA